ncbi:MAG: AAA family ATPase, partial [Bdellovibrionales bacterium]|nr:AAA family ATPase [Bdellovibrionales bacterium]
MELFENRHQAPPDAPLAERMRPRVLEEVLGQEHLVGQGKPLTAFRENPSSFILWGPPGVGKTTIARLIAGSRRFHQISAVLSGVAELRKLVDEIRSRGVGEVVFVDEIHRWNKAQQDSLLPHVENGTILLIGATT